MSGNAACRWQRSARPRAGCPAAMIVLLLCAGAHGATTDLADPTRQVDAARQKVKELEAKAFAERPDLKEVIDERARWEEARHAPEAVEAEARARDYLEAQRRAGNDKAKEAYDRLKDRWEVLRAIQLAEELEKSGRAKLLLVTPEAVRELMERVKILDVKLPPGAERNPGKVWEIFLARLVAAKPKLVRRIEAVERDAALPEAVTEEARRAGTRGAEFNYYHIYVSLRTPAELKAATDELHRLELRR